jgi:hypothetical protein
MRRMILLLTAIAGLVAVAAEPASARDGCGRGYAWNGYRCVAVAPPIVGPNYYRPGYYPAPRYQQPMPAWKRAYRSQFQQCPRGYTVQDGRCQPYRGY